MPLPLYIGGNMFQSSFDYAEIVITLLSIPAYLLFFTARGYGQAWTARRLGDDTPALNGFLSLNPLAHINIIGFICLIILGFEGGFPLGLYTDISYGVTYINISDIRPVMYAENADRIAQYVKNNMEAALSTNFVIKTEENNCSNIYFEANEKISAATERYVYSSYYFSNGYMMYMIEML